MVFNRIVLLHSVVEDMRSFYPSSNRVHSIPIDACPRPSMQLSKYIPYRPIAYNTVPYHTIPNNTIQNSCTSGDFSTRGSIPNMIVLCTMPCRVSPYLVRMQCSSGEITSSSSIDKFAAASMVQYGMVWYGSASRIAKAESHWRYSENKLKK